MRWFGSSSRYERAQRESKALRLESRRIHVLASIERGKQALESVH